MLGEMYLCYFLTMQFMLRNKNGIDSLRLCKKVMGNKARLPQEVKNTEILMYLDQIVGQRDLKNCTYGL